MKAALTRIPVVLVVVLFLFGLGCDSPVGPAGPAGPQGNEGPSGTDGVPSPEMYAAIEQTFEAYFAGLNAFVEYDEFEPAGIDVFGDVFAYPVFVHDWYGDLVDVFSDSDSLLFYLDGQYSSYRTEDYPALSADMLAFWADDGDFSFIKPMAPLSSKQWFWTNALILLTWDYGEGEPETEYVTREFAFVIGSDGSARIISWRFIDSDLNYF